MSGDVGTLLERLNAATQNHVDSLRRNRAGGKENDMPDYTALITAQEKSSPVNSR